METLSQLQTNRQIYTEALAELGFEPPATTPIMRTIFITDDDKKAKAIAERAARQHLMATKQLAGLGRASIPYH